MEKLTKEIVVQTWFFRGLEDLFFAFQIDSPFHYEPFINTMGFEKICKSYLLSENSFEYENLGDSEAKEKINSLAMQWGHDLKRMVNKIKKSTSNQKLEHILNKDFDGYTGVQLIKVMEAAYLECRYPVPKRIHTAFPIGGHSDMYWEPICSSGIEKFCFTFTRMIMVYLEERFNILISKNEFNKIITGEAGVRFCNLFFKEIPADFSKVSL